MSFSYASGLLIGLPVLVATWIGVVALARAGRTGAWWTMLAGAVLATLGRVAGILWMLGGSMNAFGGAPGQGLMMMVAGSVTGLAVPGTLVFAIGFALHGLRQRGMAGRVAELEAIIAAQQEQLGRVPSP